MSIVLSRSDHGSRPKKFMIIRLGQSQFAIPLSQVREVIGLGQISPLPQMPKFFAGVINLRGRIVSTINLKHSLSGIVVAGEQTTKTRRPSVIITEFNNALYGAIVDEVVEVQAYPSDSIDHAVDSVSVKDFIDGIIKRKDNELAPILSLEKAMRIHELTRTDLAA
jgi:purine-binding chemotaxis protein CheW